jgi:hypothetical protein
MGLFYTNLVVYGGSRKVLSTRKALSHTLRRLRRTAFISRTYRGYVAVFDRANDEQDFDDIEQLGRDVTAALTCSALAAALHDDDVLYLWLFRDGQLLDCYDSLPGYFDPEAEPGPPSGGSGELLCQVFERRGHEEQVERLLRANLLDGELPEIGGELERHAAIVRELKMPLFLAGVGYAAIAGGYVPEEFSGIPFDAVHPRK